MPVNGIGAAGVETSERDPPIQRTLLLGATLALRMGGGPLSGLVSSYYEASVHLFTSILVARFREHIASVYLRHGMVLGLFVPGISDADILFIFRRGTPELILEQARTFYRRWCRCFPVLDRRAAIFDEGFFTPAEPKRYYRLLQGRSTWRVLHGSLPVSQDIDNALFVVGKVTDLADYWIRLVATLRRSRFEPNLRLAMLEHQLVKTIAEFSNAFREPPVDRRYFSRDATLADLLDGKLDRLLPPHVLRYKERLRPFVAFSLCHRFQRSFFASPQLDGQTIDLTFAYMFEVMHALVKTILGCEEARAHFLAHYDSSIAPSNRCVPLEELEAGGRIRDLVVGPPMYLWRDGFGVDVTRTDIDEWRAVFSWT